MKPHALFQLLNLFFISTFIGISIPFSFLIRRNNHAELKKVSMAEASLLPSISLNSAVMEENTISISSTSFIANGNIPLKYSCEGDNVNPPLSIRNIPPNAKSLALIVDDPDAPNGTFVHWVAWNIPVSTETINENSHPGTEGKNGAAKNGYTGPCPPAGTHHYHFKIYALDITLDLKKDADKAAVENAMKGHQIASGELIGLYKKSK